MQKGLSGGFFESEIEELIDVAFNNHKELEEYNRKSAEVIMMANASIRYGASIRKRYDKIKHEKIARYNCESAARAQ